MPEATFELMLQLLSWISERPRVREEVLEAWRTSCPRLSIWEDVCMGGFVEYDSTTKLVSLTPKGRALLDDANQRNRSLCNSHTGG